MLAEDPTVIVLSWDGVRHDYPERTDTPALDRIEREGARAQRLTPVFPTNTFPNHVSLATGASPGRHGIVNNRFLDRVRGEYESPIDTSWIDAEPLWIAAERQGVRAATYFWLGSEADWQGQRQTHRYTPFDSRVPESKKVDQILAWLDLPEAQRPRLIMSYWRGCDGVGHQHGPDADEIAVQLRDQDAQLARLLSGLDTRKAWTHTTLLIVSDHGMAAVSKWIDPMQPLETAGIQGRAVSGAGMAYVWLDDPAQTERARRILDELEHVSAYASESLPQELGPIHPQRSGHVIAVTEPPYVLMKPSALQALAMQNGVVGSHGYPPALPEMGAIFYAIGRGVPKGAKLPEVRTLDVAATVSRWLGIEPPRGSEGRPIESLDLGLPRGGE